MYSIFFGWRTLNLRKLIRQFFFIGRRHIQKTFHCGKFLISLDATRYFEQYCRHELILYLQYANSQCFTSRVHTREMRHVNFISQCCYLFKLQLTSPQTLSLFVHIFNLTTRTSSPLHSVDFSFNFNFIPKMNSTKSHKAQRVLHITTH